MLQHTYKRHGLCLYNLCLVTGRLICLVVGQWGTGLAWHCFGTLALWRHFCVAHAFGADMQHGFLGLTAWQLWQLTAALHCTFGMALWAPACLPACNHATPQAIPSPHMAHSLPSSPPPPSLQLTEQWTHSFSLHFGNMAVMMEPDSWTKMDWKDLTSFGFAHSGLILVSFQFGLIPET